MKSFVQLNSEIGKLRTVILHRPGDELNYLIPPYLEYMLSEDTPHVRKAGLEHDNFAALLRENGAEVLYLKELFQEILKEEMVSREFIDEYCQKANIASKDLRSEVKLLLQGLSPQELQEQIFRGILKRDLSDQRHSLLPLAIDQEYPFVTEPLCGIYFTRDIGIFIGNGLAIGNMNMPFRSIESLLVKYIHKYHPRYQKDPVPLWYGFNEGYPIEGGDVLVLSDKVLAIGCGERTSLGAVETIAHRLFQQGFEQILVFALPKDRRFMHLDVLFTMVDRDKFLVTPSIANNAIDLYSIRPGKNETLTISKEEREIKTILAEALGLDKVLFIPVGGGDIINAPREHWNMGSNVLVLAPGKVVAYDRNDISNQLLRENGVEVLTFGGCELSRGRGGPRCMSMPVYRDLI
ncbi:MAG: arginine deiminase [Firmicutes bacterium]|nr:arginine deiminase [Bacillota bacterium]